MTIGSMTPMESDENQTRIGDYSTSGISDRETDGQHKNREGPIQSGKIEYCRSQVTHEVLSQLWNSAYLRLAKFLSATVQQA